jgi:hypothetical protein
MKKNRVADDEYRMRTGKYPAVLQVAYASKPTI